MFCFNDIELGLDECEKIYTVLVLFNQALYVVNSLKMTGYSVHGEATFVQEAAPDYRQCNVQHFSNIPDFSMCSFYL